MQPTIGQIIIYKYHDGEPPLPAIVFRVEGAVLHLNVFTRQGVEYATASSMADVPQSAIAGQWWWPERV